MTSARAKTAAVSAASPVSQSKQWLSVLPSTSSRISGASDVERATYVDDGLEDVVVDVDQLERVARGVAVLGHDEGDLLALEPDLVGRQHRLDVAREGRHPGEAAFGEHRAGDDGLDLRVRLGTGGVDADQTGVRHRRAEHGEVQHPRQLDVVAVATLATDEPPVLLAEHPAVAPGLDRRDHLGHDGSVRGCSAAHWTDFTMLA